MSLDLSGVSIFMAVAEARSFRVASQRLGVTRSAASQALKRFEDQLGVALLQRTTRSVSLTEAGELLYRSAGPTLGNLQSALNAARDFGAQPSGVLRLSVSSIAESFLTGEVLAGFRAANPGVQLDVFISCEVFDIVAAGFDAGVRLGEVIEQDMIAVPVSGPQRQLAVASPDYIARRGRPAHPRDLTDHSCIGWRSRPDLTPYRWEFSEDGRDFDVAVGPEMTTNDMNLMIRLACAGAGITFSMEETLRPYLERGELVTLVEDFCPVFPGFYLFYPKRDHPPAKLRALVEYLQRLRRGRPGQ